MDKMAQQKLSRTCFVALFAFLVLAFLFAMGREIISQVNIWFLAMTGEVTIVQSDEKPLPPEMVFQQEKLKAANKINKVEAPVKPQENNHVKRKRKAENGFYVTPEMKEQDKWTVYVGKKENIVANAHNWKSADDLSFRFLLIREKEGFRVVVVVKDDLLRARNDKVQHLNDCVEIYFDVRPEGKRGKDPYEKGVYHALIVPYFGMEKNANTMIFHFTSDSAMPPGCWIKSAEIKDFGYRVEAYFPFSMFAYPPDDELNFDVGVIDYDEDDSNFTQMVWSGSEENYKGAMWFGRMKKAASK